MQWLLEVLLRWAITINVTTPHHLISGRLLHRRGCYTTISEWQPRSDGILLPRTRLIYLYMPHAQVRHATVGASTIIELHSIPNCCYVPDSHVVKAHSLFRSCWGGGGGRRDRLLGKGVSKESGARLLQQHQQLILEHLWYRDRNSTRQTKRKKVIWKRHTIRLGQERKKT